MTTTHIAQAIMQMQYALWAVAFAAVHVVVNGKTR